MRISDWSSDVCSSDLEIADHEVPSTGVGIAWDRRFDEVGGQITENKSETIRSWLGLRGKISDSWNWEASFGYGQYKQDQRSEEHTSELQSLMRQSYAVFCL